MWGQVLNIRTTSCAERDVAKFVRRFIAAALNGGEPTIAKAAEASEMSVRTLQRRLEDVGLTFQELVNEVRLEKAVRLLLRPGASVAAVASALGYSDPAHFTRAFRSWTGETPSAFRRRLRHGCRRRP